MRDEDNIERRIANLKCERMFRSSIKKSRAALPLFSSTPEFIFVKSRYSRCRGGTQQQLGKGEEDNGLRTGFGE